MPDFFDLCAGTARSLSRKFENVVVVYVFPRLCSARSPFEKRRESFSFPRMFSDQSDGQIDVGEQNG